jgi:hypothetical protein
MKRWTWMIREPACRDTEQRHCRVLDAYMRTPQFAMQSEHSDVGQQFLFCLSIPHIYLIVSSISLEDRIESGTAQVIRAEIVQYGRAP